MSKDEFELSRTVLTEEAFEEMGWHDCQVHSIAFFPDENEIGFDIDYILKWVKPGSDETYFKFWVSPATLIFHNVNEVKTELEPTSGLSIDRIVRSDPRNPINFEYLEQKKQEWLWNVECMEGEIKMYSIGYSLFLRKPPKLYGKQFLTLAERGGISFSRQYENT
jgi:hypothetical protein